MLSKQTQIILIILFVAILIWLLREVKYRRLELRYTLSWLLLDVTLLLLAIFPRILTIVSRALGIYNPMNMLFFFGFVFSLIVIYTLTAAVSKMSGEIKRLAQKVALLSEKKRGTEKWKKLIILLRSAPMEKARIWRHASGL